jgi:hypothetical protein
MNLLPRITAAKPEVLSVNTVTLSKHDDRDQNTDQAGWLSVAVIATLTW